MTADGQKSRWLYDGWERVHKSADARGNVQWRKHDLLGRVLSVHEPDGNVRRFSYDEFDNVTRAQDHHAQVQYGDSSTETYTYRADGALLSASNETSTVAFMRDGQGKVVQEQ